ncbi:MAG: hypothetical protein DDT22_01010 [candidate division WS2 bacterium]|nr:hypothetical protein [Candidatus Lithacetigena glycinireducens]
MKEINIIPLGKVDQKTLDYLKVELEKKFGLEVEVASAQENPDYAYNPQRRQYHSTTILEKMKANKSTEEIILGIVDLDLYVPNLNFVFGEAWPLMRAAVISLTRLRAEYYSLPKNEKLFRERMVKEAVHELGHIFGLNHCRDSKCVMYFSNSLLDTDKKSSSLCSNCLNILPMKKEVST